MDELIGRLRDRAAFEDERCRKAISDAGLVVEVIYSGSVTGAILREAADALEVARADAERWRELDRIASDPDFELKCDACGWTLFKELIDAARQGDGGAA